MKAIIAANCVKTRRPASYRAISPQRLDTVQEPLRTIQDLLDTIRRREAENSHLLAMLTATAAHISMHLGVPRDKLDIRRLLDVKSGLQAYFKERGFKRNSVSSYTNYLRILLQKASERGWIVCRP